MLKTSRKTISLALIAKNEEKNISRLFDSIEGCFDEIILIDTGSTDKTKEMANIFGAKVFDFEWVDDFSKARNFAFSKATCDYVMWLDLDDVLSDKSAFIKWRDTAMEFNRAWFATYHYAIDSLGKPIISFMRERVFRRDVDPTWRYPLHEGIVIQSEWQPNYATTWTVNHMRDADDIKADKSRNINILEKMPAKDPRMKFYFGKELYEANRPQEALLAFADALKEPALEFHDRLLSYQYAAYSAVVCFDQIKNEYQEEKKKYFDKAIEYALQGLKLDANRAEFHVTMGDLYLKAGDLVHAVPCFGAAKVCIHSKSGGSAYEGAVYSFVDSYGELPCLQLAKIYAHLGQLDKARKEALDCIATYGNKEAETVLVEVDRLKRITDIDGEKEQTEDIVFSCPPNQAYEFDEEIYKTKPLGGSETALVQMARHLKQKTKRRVMVFNGRSQDLIADSGVEYISNAKLNEYMSTKKPHAHVAWRHNTKLTHARTYLWCHDLTTRGVESGHNFDKIMCLSQFHKDYVQAIQGVPEEKITLTRNGIDPIKFDFEHKEKNPNKVVWMSSPDRGLDRSMLVMDKLRDEFPELELHVYYGLENLDKYGLKDLADKLHGMMAERPWVKYHGFTEQNKMYREVSDAVLWLHPCNFIETFCITALEMLALKIFPVARKLGALANTLADAESKLDAILIPHDCVTDEEILAYRDAAAYVLRNKKWQDIEFDIDSHDWSKVADEWTQFMEL